MTQEEIKNKRKELEDKITELQYQIEHVRLDLKLLQSKCQHPDKYSASCMGEPCGGCPDCGAHW